MPEMLSQAFQPDQEALRVDSEVRVLLTANVILGVCCVDCFPYWTFLFKFYYHALDVIYMIIFILKLIYMLTLTFNMIILTVKMAFIPPIFMGLESHDKFLGCTLRSTSIGLYAELYCFTVTDYLLHLLLPLLFLTGIFSNGLKIHMINYVTQNSAYSRKKRKERKETEKKLKKKGYTK